MFANSILFLSGYVIHFGLGRYLGPVDYGTFGVVLSLMTTINFFVTSGIPMSASKYIAEDYSRAGSVIKDANRIQLLFCFTLFSLYFGLAEVIANLLNDLSLTPYIRISALAIPGYALYSIYSAGYLNGLRKFGRQAMSSIGVSITRIIAVSILVVVGFGVNGAIMGYVATALIGFLLAWRLLGQIDQSEVNPGWRRLVGFSIPATLFSVTFFFLMSIDLYVVKAIGVGEAEVGYYTSATTISKLTYFLFAGLATSLFPSVSRSTSSNNAELTNSYIRESMRYMFMLLIPGLLLISATSTELLTLVYSSRYVSAASSLSILAFGLGFLSIFFVLSNVIMGSDKPWIVLMMILPLVAFDIGLNVFLVPRFGLLGAAWATTVTGFFGMGVSSLYVIRRLGALVALKSLGRICLASLIIYFIALQIPLSPLWLPLLYIALFGLYMGILWLTMELKRDDLATFKRLVPLGRFNDGASLSP